MARVIILALKLVAFVRKNAFFKISTRRYVLTNILNSGDYLKK